MNRIQTLLVAIDCTEPSRAALRQAARIATWNHSKLHVVHVVDGETVYELAEWWGVSESEAKDRCIDSARAHVHGFVESVQLEVDPTFHVLAGSPIDCIRRLTKELKADLVVSGANGQYRGPRSGMLATRLVRKIPTKVLLVQSPPEGRFRKIMTCIDFSENSLQVVEQARRLSEHEPAEVLHYHTYRSPADQAFSLAQRNEYEERLLQRLRNFSQPAQLPQATHHVRPGEKHRSAIAQFARENSVDLIVLGAKGVTDLDHVLMGSTAERLIRDLPCSVLVVKPVAQGRSASANHLNLDETHPEIQAAEMVEL